MMAEDKKNPFFTRRSIRRFKQDPLSESFLIDCVNCARLAPSGKNLQPIDYIVVTDPEIRKKLFSCLHWAGYLEPSWKPNDDEQPMAYIVPILKKNVSPVGPYDVGIALAHIVLYAENNDIGSCIIQNIDKVDLQTLLRIPQDYDIGGVVALGVKKEHPVLETDENKRKYYLDEENVLHVPKRPLQSLLHKQYYS